jgi:hypothetical protein
MADFEFGGCLYATRNKLLAAIAEEFMTAGGANSVETMLHDFPDQSDDELAGECIEGWGLDTPGEDDDPSSMTRWGVTRTDIATAIGEFRRSLVPPTEPDKPDLGPATKKMLDLCSSHITHADMEILQDRPCHVIPRTVPHAYGAIMFVCADEIPEQLAKLRTRGYSDAFVALFELVCQQDDGWMLINFDADAPQTAGLPVFDW